MPRADIPYSEDPRDAEDRALEAARTALYRPGADSNAHRDYIELAERIAARRAPEPMNPTEVASHRRSKRLAVTGSIAMAVIGLAAALAITLALPRSDAVRMTPMRFVGATDPAAQEAAVLSLFAGSFAARNSLALRAAVDPPPALAHGGILRAAVSEIVGAGTLAVPQGTRTGTVTVIVLCTTATRFQWTLTADEQGRSREIARSSSTTCLGTASYATATISEEGRAILRFAGTRARSALVALVVAPAAA